MNTRKGEEKRQQSSAVRPRSAPTQLGPGNVPAEHLKPGPSSAANPVPPREQRGFGSVILPSAAPAGKQQGAAGPSERQIGRAHV